MNKKYVIGLFLCFFVHKNTYGQALTIDFDALPAHTTFYRFDTLVRISPRIFHKKVKVKNIISKATKHSEVFTNQKEKTRLYVYYDLKSQPTALIFEEFDANNRLCHQILVAHSDLPARTNAPMYCTDINNCQDGFGLDTPRVLLYHALLVQRFPALKTTIDTLVKVMDDNFIGCSINFRIPYYKSPNSRSIDSVGSIIPLPPPKKRVGITRILRVETNQFSIYDRSRDATIIVMRSVKNRLSAIETINPIFGSEWGNIYKKYYIYNRKGKLKYMTEFVCSEVGYNPNLDVAYPIRFYFQQ